VSRGKSKIHGHFAGGFLRLICALGELRGTFGIHVANIAAAFKLDVEDRLASILPANADADTGDDDRLFRKLYL
jgi:hypothetical protein